MVAACRSLLATLLLSLALTGVHSSALAAPSSADRGQLAYVGTDGHLWVLNLTTGARSQLTDRAHETVHDPRWSPDGKNIAFLSYTKEPGVFEPGRRDDVYVIDATGGAPRKLTTLDEPMHDLAWFPDGAMLLFGTGFNGGFRVNTVSLNSGTVQTLAPLLDGRPVERLWPVVAPNGWIAALDSVIVDGASSQAVVYMNADGSGRRVVMEIGSSATPYLEPSWNPHEPALAFGMNSLAVQVSAFGGDPVVMAEADNEITSKIYYSPDASHIAFAAWDSEPGRQRGGDSQLTISRRDGSALVTLSQAGDATRTRVVWSNDSSRLLFSTGTFMAPEGTIYAVNADGTGLTPISEAKTDLGPGFDWLP